MNGKINPTNQKNLPKFNPNQPNQKIYGEAVPAVNMNKYQPNPNRFNVAGNAEESVLERNVSRNASDPVSIENGYPNHGAELHGKIGNNNFDPTYSSGNPNNPNYENAYTPQNGEYNPNNTTNNTNNSSNANGQNSSQNNSQNNSSLNNDMPPTITPGVIHEKENSTEEGLPQYPQYPVGGWNDTTTRPSTPGTKTDGNYMKPPVKAPFNYKKPEPYNAPNNQNTQTPKSPNKSRPSVNTENMRTPYNNNNATTPNNTNTANNNPNDFQFIDNADKNIVYGDYSGIPDEYSAWGYLKVKVGTGLKALPYQGAVVAVHYRSPIDGSMHLVYNTTTDENGLSPILALKTLPASMSLVPGNEQTFAEYDLDVSAPNFPEMSYRKVPIFAGVSAVQNVNLVPTGDANQQFIYNEE
jgi:hypothetical protein